jgi:tRNA pseudouridine13 synthase
MSIIQRRWLRCLKDKHAMTIQYISLPAKFEEKIGTFSHEKIKILDSTRHNNKIRVEGNRFEIRLLIDDHSGI